MRAVVIDVYDRTIKVDYSYNDYRDIYRLGKFSSMTALRLNDSETLYINDEGLLHGETNYFILSGPDFKYKQPLAGNGVILGNDRIGNEVDSKLAIHKVTKNITFRRLRCVGFSPMSQGRRMDPILGEVNYINAGTPMFEDLENETNVDEDDTTGLSPKQG